MTRVLADMSVSLDGFVDSPTDGAESLHRWLFDGDHPSRHAGDFFKLSEVNRGVLDEMLDRVGATVVGRRWFDVVDGWGGEPPFDGPVVVLTHEPPVGWDKGGDRFTFVTGLEAAVSAAEEAAGGKDVSVGGANVIRQCLAAGLLDEVQLHVVPVLLGDGVRLFGGQRCELDLTRVVEAPGVTHLRYRVAGRR